MSPYAITSVALGVALLAAIHARHRSNTLMMLAAAAAALILTVRLLMDTPTIWLLGAAGIAVVGVLVALQFRSRTAATVNRWGDRTRRTSGVATTVELARVSSGHAMRRRAGTVRPTMAGRSRLAPPIRTCEVGVQLARVGWLWVWSSIEDVILVFGGPRTGKTGWLAGRIIDAPGAVLVTSTRTDLYRLTAPMRARKGPVFVFNAVGLAGVDSTITFDPLTGCADPVTAAERATDMLAATSTGGGGDRQFWDAQARRVLAALLHAAALGGLHMRDVLGWVADPDGSQRVVTSLLRRSTEPAYVQDATQFVTTNDRTRSSITSTIMPALGWLTSPAASAAAASGGQVFDVEQLLRDRATVYLLGAEETQAAPLVCALTGHIAREARRIAARQPGERLDPPLTLSLDEAALISPVPLQSWTADMGGRGVTIICAFQSRAQLLSRWGETDAAVILNNSAAIMVFGGTRDRDDLDYWSRLAGDRDEEVVTTGADGRVTSRSVRKVPVLAPAQLANLPAGNVVMFRRGMAPAVGRPKMAWTRWDVRLAARRARRAGETVAAPTAQVPSPSPSPKPSPKPSPIVPPIPPPLAGEANG